MLICSTFGFGKAGKTVAGAMGGSHTNLGNGSDPFAPAYTLGLRVRRHARGMTFREIAKLHSLPGTDFREAPLRCRECLDGRASFTACADASLSESDLPKLTGVR
jgi:hypothetical protein